MDVILYESAKDKFLSALGSVGFAAPSISQFTLQSEYNQCYFGDTFRDLSFAVVHNDRVKAIVPCHMINNRLCMNGSGIFAYYDRDEKKTIKFIYDQLLLISADNNIPGILIRDLPSHREISLWGYGAYKQDAKPKSLLVSAIDLTLPDSEIHSGIRDSYRSLINSAKKEIEIHYINATNIDRGIFTQFRDFHVAIAGRETRNQASWDTQYKMIEAGCAELIVGYMQPYGLVSSALFIDYAKTTSYAVAVYNRDLFDKPLAHAPVYDAIFRAKGRGQETFFIGYLPHISEATAKEHSISHFKSGFCNRPVLDIEWSIDVESKV